MTRRWLHEAREVYALQAMWIWRRMENISWTYIIMKKCLQWLKN